MKVPYSWLKEFVEVDLPAEALADRHTMAGLEVEELVRVGEDLGAMRVGQIKTCGKHPNADKLLVLRIDLGEMGPRQLVAGLAAYYTPEELIGKVIIVVANLKPRKMKFGLSEGMVLAGVGQGGAGLALATFEDQLLPGDKIS